MKLKKMVMVAFMVASCSLNAQEENKYKDLFVGLSHHEKSLLQSSTLEDPYVLLSQDELELLDTVCNSDGLVLSADLKHAASLRRNGVRLIEVDMFVRLRDELKELSTRSEVLSPYGPQIDSLLSRLERHAVLIDDVSYDVYLCDDLNNTFVQNTKDSTRFVHDINVTLLRPNQKTTRKGRIRVSNDMNVEGQTEVIKELKTKVIQAPPGEGSVSIQGDLTFDIGSVLEFLRGTVGTRHFLGGEQIDRIEDFTLGAGANPTDIILRITFKSGSYPQTGIYAKALILSKRGTGETSYTEDNVIITDAMVADPQIFNSGGPVTFTFANFVFNGGGGFADLHYQQSNVADADATDISFFYKVVADDIESVTVLTQ